MNTRPTLSFTRIHHPALRSWYRAVALLLIPVQLLTLQPFVLWVATAEAAEPAVAVLAQPGTGLAAPYPPGHLPDLTLLQSEEAKLAVPLGPIARTLPPGAGAYVTPPLPETPTDAQLRGCALLPLPLVLAGETWPEENAALSKALRAFAHRSDREDWSALTRFLTAWPESAWRASIQMQLGKMYFERGYFTRAVKVLKEAAAAMKAPQGMPQEHLQGQIAVQLAKALARTGRIGEAAPVVAAMAEKPLWGSVGEELRRVSLATAPRKKEPGLNGACGVQAVKSLYSALLPHAPMPDVLLSAKEQKRLKLLPEGDLGMNLKQLGALSAAAAMPLLPGKRKDGEWVIPSIVHWKSDHYSVLVKKQGSRCLVRDPLLGGDFWLSEAALADETTGFALIGVPTLPKGWSAPTAAQLAGTRGQTSSATPVPTPAKKCSPSSGGGGGSDCSPCSGMPNYKLYLVQASLGITDTPVSYRPAYGPALDFTLYYYQGNIPQGVGGESDFLGIRWTTDFLSYVEDGAVSIRVSGCEEDPGMPGSLTTRIVEVEGSATVFLPGGGEAAYSVPEQGVSSGGSNGVEPCPNTQVLLFENNAMDQSGLKRMGGPGYTGGADTSLCQCEAIDQTLHPLQYERRTSDGTVYRYGVWGTAGALVGTRAYLAEIVDPQQHKVTVTYSGDQTAGNPFRLAAVTAADGAVMTFVYNDPAHEHAITEVDVAGRRASLRYDANGNLIAITDAVGMTSTFTYANYGITGMDTPYGHTAFAAGVNSNGDRWVQATQIVDGIAAKERVELRMSGGGDPAIPASVPPGEVPAGMNVLNADLDQRNSFYWDRKAMAEMGNPEPGGVFDYGKARMTHWMLDETGGVITDIPSSTKAPLEGRVWYEYNRLVTVPPTPPDNTPADQFSKGATEFQPAKVGRVVEVADAAATQLQKSQVHRYEYLWMGQVAKSVDPRGRMTIYTYNTNAIGVAQPDEVLLKVEQQVPGALATLVTYSGHDFDVTTGTADDTLPRTTTDAAGQVTTYTYNGRGQTLTATRMRNGANEVTTYTYYPPDPAGAPTHNPNAGRLWQIRGPGNVLLSTFTYDAGGRVFTSTGADSYMVTNHYDALDRPVRTVFPDGTYEQTIYNKLDAEWQRDREGRWTHTEHDSQRKAVAVTDPLGRTTRFDWCPCGALEAIVDAAGNATTFVRDLQSRVVQKVYADGKATLYEYEPKSGRLAWMQDARGVTAAQKQRTNYQYYLDNALKRVSYTDANGVSLEQTRPGDGTKINAPVDYFYDPNYKRIMRMHDGTGDTVFGYHPINPGDAVYGDGRLAAVNSDASGVLIAYTYDEYGRVKERSIDGVNNTATRNFDALGRIGTETNPLGTFSYGYVGNTGRLSRVSNGQGFATEYGYHPLVPTVAGTGDGDLRLSAIRHYKNAGAAVNSGTLDAEYDYHYAVGGNISQWTQKWGGGLSAGNDYKLAYDPADQLRGAEVSNPGSTAVRERLGYGYDLAANRTLEQRSTPTSATASNVDLSRASYNNLNQLTSRTGGTGEMEVEGTVSKPANVTINGQPATAEWKNADGSYGFKGKANLTSTGTNNVTVTATDGQPTPLTATKTIAATSSGSAIPALTYDENGNLLNLSTLPQGQSLPNGNPPLSTSYEWDAANRIVAIVYGGAGNRTEFTYDGIGRRVREVETTNGSVTSAKRLVWDGLEIAEERTVANVVTKRFYVQGEQRPATTNLLYRRDHLGTIRETTDATGAMQTRLDFDLWGRRTVLAGAGANEPTFGYTGHYWHGRSGLHLAMYRAYSADLGRWLSRDPIGHRGGLNLFCYVLNSPANRIDPLGLLSGKCCAAKVGAGYLATFKAAQDAGRNPNDSYFHCVTSCEITKKCGEQAAREAGDAKEKHGGAGQGDADDTAEDQGANADGRKFGREGRDCHKACQDAYGAPFGNPPPNNNNPSFWKWFLGL